MGQPISSAEPERLFRYSDFGVQLDHDLTVEAARLAATLQHFEATCTEPGFQVGVGHLAGNLRGYAGQNESVDSWVRQVGQGFQMADQIGLGWVRIPELPGQWMRILPLPIRLPSTWQMPIRIRPTLPRVRIPEWLVSIFLVLPWLKPRQVQVPPASWDRPEPERVPSEPAPEQVPPPTPPDSSQTAPRPGESGFGALLRQPPEPESKPESEAEPKPATAPESKPRTEPGHATASVPESEAALAREQWWHDVPAKGQQGLKYKEQPTAYGCTPTATSMILDYWHARDPANKTTSAQELLNINAGQGVFNSKGMSASNVLDEVSNLGYGVTEVHTDSNLDALKEAVAKGPVIATVKLNMKTTGENHAVVVTGVSEDGKQVRINDPWTGQAHTYSWDEFSRSWGADFGKWKDEEGKLKDYPKNSFIVICPS